MRLDGLTRRHLLNLNPRDPGPQSAREFARHGDTRQIRFSIDPGFGIDVESLNRAIRRVEPAPGARSRTSNSVFAEFTGQLRAPLLTIHETADFRVPLALQKNYRRRVEAAGSRKFLVQRVHTGSGHCGIPASVRQAAFDDLLTWMDTGAIPDGDDVLGDVSQLGR